MNLSDQPKIKVAILGCGQFAQVHVNVLKQIETVDIVACCDQDIWRAKELAKKTPGAMAYASLDDMLAQEHPNVVHILTPPATHAPLAIKIMNSGCSVLIEKPMALNTAEVDVLIEVAKKNGVTLTTNHNYLFNPSILKAREMIAQGLIGDVVYVDSFYGLNESGSSYSSASGKSHWAWRLPGSAFTNFLPHLIYLQLAFLQGPVEVAGVTLAKGEGVDTPPTELTVLLKGAQSSGVMAVSMSAKPYAKFINIYGTKGIIHADLATEVCSVHYNHRVPGMISKVLFNFEDSFQLFNRTLANTTRVALKLLKNNPGLYNHLRALYGNLYRHELPPVSGEDGRKMVAIMQQVTAEIDRWQEEQVKAEPVSKPAQPETLAEKVLAERKYPGTILVTGATGNLGSELVEAFSRVGIKPRVMIHNKDRISADLQQKADLVYGDLHDEAAIRQAMQGVDVVIHCAAMTRNNVPWEDHYQINIMGSERVFKAAQEAGVKQVIHISSVIVYGLSSPAHNQSLTELADLPTHPDRFAYYMRSKIGAEEKAHTYMAQGVPITILRIGVLYGEGGDRSVGRGLMQLGPFRLIIGSGQNTMPFTYIGNVVDAILYTMMKPETIGETYNVVDEPQLKFREALRLIKKITGETSIPISVPTFLLTGFAKFLEWKQTRSGSDVPPKLSNYVVRSSVRNILYDTRKLHTELGVKQEVSLEEGFKRSLLSNSK